MKCKNCKPNCDAFYNSKWAVPMHDWHEINHENKKIIIKTMGICKCGCENPEPQFLQEKT